MPGAIVGAWSALWAAWGVGEPALPAPASVNFDIRLRLHAPDGSKGRILKGASNIIVTLVDSGTATIKFSLPMGANDPTLHAPMIVGVEYSAAGGMYEPIRNNLFICDADDGDLSDVSDTVSFTGESYVPWLLARNLLHWSSSAKNGERDWIQFPSGDTGSATPGYIMNGMMVEGQARGWGPMVEWDFTGLKDSTGADWSLAGEKLWWPPFKLLTPVSQVLQSLSGQGFCEWWTEGTTLRMVRPGTGEDRTAQVALGGKGFTRSPRRASFKDVFTDLTVVPEKARNWLYLENTGADDRFGRLEATMTQSGVSDHTVATELAQSTLLAGRKLKLELAYEWAVTEGMPRPLLDFNIGDLVRVRENRYEWAEHRVIGLVLTKDETVTVRAVTGDKLLTHAAKIAAKVGSAQMGSAIPGGSGVALPQSNGPASEAPAAPTGLTVSANEGYFADDGTARANVTLGWNAVTETADGALCDVDAYEVWHRVGDAAPQSVRVLDVSVVIDSWESGVERLVKVRARSAANVWGEFSTEINVTPALPPDDLQTPTVPSLTTLRGVITASWGGKLAGPIDPPPGFRAVIGEASLSEDGEYVPVGQSLSVAGYMTIPGYDIGDQVWVRFRAVDRLGRITDPSAAASITVEGVAATDFSQPVKDAFDAIEQAVVSVVTEYAVNSSESVAPTTGWDTGTPARTPGTFIWSRQIITYGDDTQTTTDPVLLTGNTGPQGDPGPAGESIEIAGSVATYGDLPDDLTSGDAGKGYLVEADGLLYIWDGTAFPTNGNGVAFKGDKGDPGNDGKGIASTTIRYQAGSSATTPPSGTWLSSAPATTTGQYLWTRIVITYTDSTTSTAYSVAAHGATGADGDDGADGKGVSSVTSYYLLVGTGSPAPAKPTNNPPGGSWSLTEPTYSAATELYRAELVVFTDSSFAWSDVSKVSAYTAAVQAVSLANLAQAAAEGKVKASQSDPGQSVGRIWLVLNGSGQVIGIKISNGSSWESYALIADQVLVPSSVGPTVIADGAISTPKLAADAVEAANLAAGAVEAQHLNVGVGDTGARMELVGTGLILYDENDAPIVSLTTVGDQVVSVSRVGPDGDLIAASSIDSDGNGTFESVFVSTDLDVAGTSLVGEFAGLTYNGQTIDTPMLERLPRGIVYRAGLGVDSGGRLLINPVSTTIQVLGDGQAAFHEGRLYDVSFDTTFLFQWTGAVNSGGVQMEVWFSDDPINVASPSGTSVRWMAIESNAGVGVGNIIAFPPSAPIELAGEKYILIRLVKNGTARNYVVANIDVEPKIIIRDVGPVVTAVDGGSIKSRVTSGTSVPVNPQPKTVSVQASWSANYSSGGGRITGAGGLYNDYRMVQGGGISGGSNNRMGLIGFPSLGLSGKTVTGAWVYLKNRHTGFGSGATVKLAASNLTSAPSSAPTPGATRWNSSTKKGEGKWHALPSSLYSAIASGSFRCLQIGGPGVNSTNGSDYCIFDGDYDANSATNNAVHPVLKVSYK